MIQFEISEKKVKSSDNSLNLLLEFLELLLGVIATRSCLLREIFRLGFLRFLQLLHLFLTRWHSGTFVSLWLILFAFLPS